MRKSTHDPYAIPFRVSAWLLRRTGSELRKAILRGDLDPVWKDGKMTFTADILSMYLKTGLGYTNENFLSTPTGQEFQRRLNLWVKQSPTA